MNRKPGLSIERHWALGLELANVQDRLTSIATEIVNAYPANSWAHRMLSGSPSSKALGGVFRLRCELGDLMFARYPDDPRVTPHVYFPLRCALGREAGSRGAATLTAVAGSGAPP